MAVMKILILSIMIGSVQVNMSVCDQDATGMNILTTLTMGYTIKILLQDLVY